MSNLKSNQTQHDWLIRIINSNNSLIRKEFRGKKTYTEDKVFEDTGKKCSVR